MTARNYSAQIISAIEKGEITNKEQLNKAKLKTGKKLGMKELPTNPDILAQAKKPSKKLRELLSIKPLRTLSGVAPVAIMTKPISCPHGTCIYCPGGPKSFFGSVPQSYTGNEPATMRAISNNYDPYLQTMNRLSQYYATAHSPEKLELIIMGGTFPSFTKEYRQEFVSGAFQAANDFGKKFFAKGVFDDEKFNNFFRGKKLMGESLKNDLMKMKKEPSVEREHARNEKSHARIVTMCIETKPDYCKEEHVNEMLRLGATRVEMGAQSLYNEVLKYTNRGHTVQDTIEATRTAKDAGLKVSYHMMPGQPLSSKEKDKEMFKELFANPDYRPDGLKIYPCMVMPGTALAELYKKGRFTPLSTEEAAEIIMEAKRFFPEYTRVHRVQRDIPTKLALTGIDKNNLRQITLNKMAESGAKCRCIRCRGSGISFSNRAKPDYASAEIRELNYEASKGREVFISIEDKNDLLLGFCRLRQPSRQFRSEFTQDTAAIRELHVFGSALALGEKNSESQQHRGFGKRLVEQAEETAKREFGSEKMLVISGVGARQYYSEKLGYKRQGAYMAKRI